MSSYYEQREVSRSVVVTTRRVFAHSKADAERLFDAGEAEHVEVELDEVIAVVSSTITRVGKP